MRLTRHYSGSPVCAPSRCVLMTGKHPGHAAVRNNKEHKPEGQWAMPASEPMMTEMFKDAGYRTGSFGKWGLGPPGTHAGPMQRGVDRFFGYNCQRHAHSYYPNYLWDDHKRIALNNEPPVPGHGKLKPKEDHADPDNYARFIGKDYAPDRILAAAKQFVSDNKDKPFFLYYPSVIPHLALHIPDEELKAYEGQFDETPYPGGKGYTPHFKPRAAYAAMITRLDRSVGEILDMLDEHGVEDIEIIIAVAYHRHMKENEIKRMVGDRVFNRFWPDRLYNHDAEDPDQLAYLGKTDAGEEVELSKAAVESDLIVYVNLNLVPMDGGHKSVGVGLCSGSGLNIDCLVTVRFRISHKRQCPRWTARAY